jgi:16S rRNA (cytosine1402-N4)-methyltransferase
MSSRTGNEGGAEEPAGNPVPVSGEGEIEKKKFDPGGGFHVSVMKPLVIDALEPSPRKIFLDGTLGGGGHSKELLKAGARVIACDRDRDALKHAKRRLKRFGDRFEAFHSNFTEMDQVLVKAGVEFVDGVLLDLGVSSHQIDEPARGFSFMRPGPLDMRMDKEAGRTAADLVSSLDADELARIFLEYGEERAARRIARKIVKERSAKPITTTEQLSALVGSVVSRGGGKHPATRVFQALRIAVNEELENLEIALRKSVDCLASHGVLAVITFHSLEDRIVKNFLRRHSEKEVDRPNWPRPRPNREYFFDLPSRKPLTAGEEEIAANTRARSAKLRIARRVVRGEKETTNKREKGKRK